jgi:hypothetical protein
MSSNSQCHYALLDQRHHCILLFSFYARLHLLGHVIFLLDFCLHNNLSTSANYFENSRMQMHVAKDS